MPLAQRLEKFEHALKKFLKIIVFLLFALMTVLAFSQVCSRFLLNISLSWSEEVSRFTLVWLIYMASILTYGDKLHIAVDAFTNKLKGRTSHVVQLINRLCVMLFCVLVVIGAVEFMPITAMQISPGSGIVMAYMYLSIPVSMALMGCITLREINTILLAMKQPEEDTK
jgi:TRAP-type C4-dicarboxylate transport system permease small subunit